jgi:GlpG protein
VWRLFTPCLLHANIIHILFNLLWFMILGKLIEFRLGIARYLLLIVAVGIFSNTAQYLMSGAEFLGISGVLCGMIAFIWMRQRCAAWEGYELQPGTFAFFMFFILTMAAIQFLSFVLEFYNGTTLSVGIANTAHLSGALAGFILGRMKFFSWKVS